MTPPLIFREDATRFALFPLQHDDLWRLYKQHMACFWTAEEIDLSGDHYADLDAGEKLFIEQVLGFFSWADGIVQENLVNGFLSDVHVAEARTFYAFQAAMEGIHAETYALLIDSYIPKDRALKVYHSLQHCSAVSKKAEWMMRWMDPSRPFRERLIAFACVEGIMFSGAFCAVYWLKKRSNVRMPGLTFSNELIARDEGLHCEFACVLYKKLYRRSETLPKAEVDALLQRWRPGCDPATGSIKPMFARNVQDVEAVTQLSREDALEFMDELASCTRCKDERAAEIVREAVAVEAEFVNEALPLALIGMNAQLMTQYVQFVADRLLRALDHSPVYDVANPFDWMELISLQGKTNFFEKRVGDYQKANVMANEPRVFDNTADF